MTENGRIIIPVLLIVAILFIKISSSGKEEESKDLFLVTLLPNDSFHLPSLDKVRPAMILGAEKVEKLELLPGYRIQLEFRDSRCSNVYAPHSAVEVYKLNKVHVFFGPSCDLSLGRFPYYYIDPSLDALRMCNKFLYSRFTREVERLESHHVFNMQYNPMR